MTKDEAIEKMEYALSKQNSRMVKLEQEKEELTELLQNAATEIHKLKRKVWITFLSTEHINDGDA